MRGITPLFFIMLMIILKYICFVIAVVCTGLYINNFIADFTQILTWRNTFAIEGKDANKDESAEFATARFVLSIIMAITWGVVFIL